MFFRKKPPHLRTGARGERAASLYLRLRGYRILERNFLCPLGEIDIVASKRGTIVFVEVRTRQDGALVDPIESINDMKLAHIIDAARYFLWVRGKENHLCRFDIISVSVRGFFKDRINHYIDTFRITDERPTRGVRLKAWIRRQPRPRGRMSLRDETGKSRHWRDRRGNGGSA